MLRTARLDVPQGQCIDSSHLLNERSTRQNATIANMMNVFPLFHISNVSLDYIFIWGHLRQEFIPYSVFLLHSNLSRSSRNYSRNWVYSSVCCMFFSRSFSSLPLPPRTRVTYEVPCIRTAKESWHSSTWSLVKVAGLWCFVNAYKSIHALGQEDSRLIKTIQKNNVMTNLVI